MTPINADLMEEAVINQSKRTERQIANQFKPGNQIAKGNHKPRTRLSNRFVDDLTAEWVKRGAVALTEIDSKTLVSTCVAVLPKDVLVSLDSSDKVRWIVASDPVNTSEWYERHGLGNEPIDIQPIDSDTD